MAVYAIEGTHCDNVGIYIYIYTVQKLGRWKTISMVMRYAHHHPESLHAGIEILDRAPEAGGTVLSQSAN